MTKKMIIIAVVAISAILAGCAKVENDTDMDKAWCHHGRYCYTKVVEIEGHKYIIMDGIRSGNIIHSASCECGNK